LSPPARNRGKVTAGLTRPEAVTKVSRHKPDASRSLLLSVLTRPFKHLRTKLLVSMLAVVFLLTASVLVLVQARMGKQVRLELASTLRTESRVYAEIERARREQSQQSAALIANQSSLKALMSTNDALTVEDGSQTISADQPRGSSDPGEHERRDTGTALEVQRLHSRERGPVDEGLDDRE